MLIPKERREAFNESVSLFWKGASIIDAIAGVGWWVVDRWFSDLDVRILYIVWIVLPLIWIFVVHRLYVKNTSSILKRF